MIGTNAFNYINVLDKAADASILRHEVISNNIANNDTANYKRKDVRFEEFLKKELTGGESLNKQVASVNINKLDATTYTDLANLNYRIDGNNVNVETENANLAENQIRYYALLDSMTQEFNRLKSVLQR